MAQHEHPSIIHLYLEVPMLGIEPAVEDFEHGEAALAKGESAWLLFAAIAGVALDADIHRGTWQDVQGRFSPIDESHTRVEVSGDDDAGMEVEKIMGDLRRVELTGRRRRRQAGYYLSLHAGGQGLALRGFLRNALIWPAICLNSSSLP